MSNNRILIKNAQHILTGLKGKKSRANATDIYIENGIINNIGINLPYQKDDKIIDATECIIYPAWVNTHHHLFQSILKGEPKGLNQSLTNWLATTPYRFRGVFDEYTFRIAVRIGLIELLRSGCATVADHHYLYWPKMPFDGAAILFDEADKFGMRFVLCRGGATLTRNLEKNLPLTLQAEKFDDFMQDVEKLVKTYHQNSASAYRRIVMAPTTALHSMTPEELKETACLARQLGIRLHTHLSETVDYLDYARKHFNMTPVEFCAKYDWIGHDVWMAHLVKLLPHEIELLGQTHTGIAHCPQSNGRLGSGIANLITMEQAGMQISIGVDGAASNEAADMLSETHATWLMQRARKGMIAIPKYDGGTFEGGADVATIEDVIRWGTSGGATVLGLTDIGTIEIGKAADIAIYQLDDPRFFGLHDTAIGPIASGGRAKLNTLLINGKVIVKNDQVLDFDLTELAHEAQHAVHLLKQRVNTI